MKISNLKIGVKLILGFVLVVVIFGAIALYQILNFNNLSALQDAGAKRADDALALSAIETRVEKVYPVIADAIINQDLEQTY